MKRVCLVVGLVVGCAPVDGDGMASSDGTVGNAAGDGGSAGDGSGADGMDATAGSSSGSAEGPGRVDGSTGDAACPEDRVPSAWSDVEGCGDVLGETFCSEGQAHVDIGTEIAYMHNPPHSGPHFPMWETWGEHASTVERGYWVHNMEHGGIVLSYLCPDGCEEELDVLRQVLVERPDARILITPDPLLEGSRFAAISWTWVHEFDAPQLEELLCFVDQHFNHAPEDVP